MKRSDVKRAAAQIRRVLNDDWDPIGAHTPDDEYDEFVWRVFGLRIDGASREQLMQYLQWASDEYVKCPIPKEQTAIVVDKIMALDLGVTEEGST